eukprot:1193959-Prorocentrum_minimum.AAC.3
MMRCQVLEVVQQLSRMFKPDFKYLHPAVRKQWGRLACFDICKTRVVDFVSWWPRGGQQNCLRSGQVCLRELSEWLPIAGKFVIGYTIIASRCLLTRAPRIVRPSAAFAIVPAASGVPTTGPPGTRPTPYLPYWPTEGGSASSPRQWSVSPRALPAAVTDKRGLEH